MPATRPSGHLLTIVGFTAEGDVVSNDPNSHRIASNDEVRTVYRRDQFERVWLGTNGGLTYVMHPRRRGAADVAGRGELALTRRFSSAGLSSSREFPTQNPHAARTGC